MSNKKGAAPDNIDERIENLQREREKRDNPNFIQKTVSRGERAFRFVTSDIWRLRSEELGGVSGFFIKILRVLYISIIEFIRQGVSQKASALTYTTLLSIVPILVILLSVAAGFGMSESVQRALYGYFPAHQDELTVALGFVERYVDSIQGNVIIIVGVVILIYSVISMFIAVENTVNQIWQIRQGRSLSRRIVSYLAGFIIMPLAIMLASLANLFVSSLSDITLLGHISLSPVASTLLQVMPYVILITFFTFFYLLVPNARVRFVPALISGILVGVAFQIFQMIYISGQIWVSRYNAIYGSFAALPLLMLYVQLTWVITLFGAQLCYAIQNADRYAFKSESDNVSRRFRDFVAVVLMKKICLAFRHQSQAYNAEELAKECDLPIAVVSDTLHLLVETRLLIEMLPKKGNAAPYYMPAVEITAITVGRVLAALDRQGSESFRVDIYDEYAEEWEVVRRARITREEEMDMLVVDL